MRKLLSLFMAAVMLVSLAPLALAHEVTPASAISKIEIEDADITPVAGKTPADMGYGNMYADGSSSKITNTDGWWYCDSTMSNLEEEDTFEVGKRYSYCWLFELNSGYTVSSSTYVTINGSRSNVDEQSSDLEDGMIWSNSVYCEDSGVIGRVDITDATLVPPVGGKAGDYLDCETDFNLPAYTDDVYWYCEAKEERVLNSEYFEKWTCYNLCIILEPMSGYEFSDDTAVYINGSAENVYDSYVNYGCLYISARAHMCGESEANVIKDVELMDVTITPPAGGRAGDYTSFNYDYIPVDFDEVVWFCDSGSYWLDDDDMFAGGEYYSLLIEIKPFSGNRFADNFNLTVNGSLDDVDFAGINQKGYLAIWTKAYLCSGSSEDKVIDKVELTGVTLTPPAGGRAGDYLDFEIDNELPVLTDDVYWCCDTYQTHLESDDTFEEGLSYSMCMIFEPMSGYTFADKPKITINGSENNVAEWSTITSAGYLRVWTTPHECGSAPEIQYIDKVSVTVTEVPPAGGKVGDYMSVTISEGAHFTVSTCFWQNYETYGNLSNDDVFEAGKTYHFFFSLYPGDGYLFANDVQIIINGKENNYHAEISHTDEHVLALWTIPAESVEAPAVTVGDVNGDEKINTADAVQVLKSAAGMIVLDEKQQLAGDTNHDGKVNTADAVLILKYAAGMISEF